jgi:protein-tyrosine phosphatase
VRALARTARDRAKVVRLGAFAPGATGTPRDVPDPWGQEAPAYAAMYDQVEEAVAGLVAAIRTGSVAQVLQAHGHPSSAGA